MPLQHQEAGPKTASPSAPTAASPLSNLPTPSLRSLDRITPAQVLYLQRAVGNRQVANLLGRNRPATDSGATGGSGPSTVGATLTVNTVGDRHEQQAVNA